MVDYNNLAVAVSLVATISHFLSYACLHEHYSTLSQLNILYIFSTLLLKKTDFSTNLHLSQGYIDKTLDQCISQSDCSVIQTYLFAIAFLLMFILFMFKKLKKLENKISARMNIGLNYGYLFAETIARWIFIALVVQSLIEIQRGDIGLSVFKLTIWLLFLVFCIFANRYMEDDPELTPIDYTEDKKKWHIKTWAIDIAEFIHQALKGIVMCLAFWQSWSHLTTAIVLVVISVLLIFLKVKQEHIQHDGIDRSDLKNYSKYRVLIQRIFLIATLTMIAFCLLMISSNDNIDFDHTIAILISVVVFGQALIIIIKFIYILGKKCKKSRSDYRQVE